MNAAILVVALTRVRLWRRRTKAGETEAERWDAFRRYLTDFPRLQEAPPATLELWERFLVYGIAFGIAERVLQGAQLHMPQELHDQSSIYWITPVRRPRLRRRPRSAIGDLGSGFGSALTPPSSGGGGFRAAAEAAAEAEAERWRPAARGRATGELAVSERVVTQVSRRSGYVRWSATGSELVEAQIGRRPPRDVSGLAPSASCARGIERAPRRQS